MITAALGFIAGGFAVLGAWSYARDYTWSAVFDVVMAIAYLAAAVLRSVAA